VVVWGDYIFVFECKNRTLSGNDATQTNYFDLEVHSQAQHVGKTVVPCVLHSLPYSRLDPIDGVYFTDASMLTRFLQQGYFRVKVPHRIGNATPLHRTALKKFWKGDKPTVDDFIAALAKPFPLSLSMKHLELTDLDFAISPSEEVVMTELTRVPMTIRSVCEAVGADPDVVFREIAEISQQARKFRRKLAKMGNAVPKPAKRPK
jgi:hypothetical protein